MIAFLCLPVTLSIIYIVHVYIFIVQGQKCSYRHLQGLKYSFRHVQGQKCSYRHVQGLKCKCSIAQCL